MEEDTNDSGLYINQDEFPKPITTSSKWVSNDEIYENNAQARKVLKDMPIYENQKDAISTTANKAYGVQNRSDYQLHQVENEDEEYVYVEVDKDIDSPEAYEDMTTFVNI